MKAQERTYIQNWAIAVQSGLASFRYLHSKTGDELCEDTVSLVVQRVDEAFLPRWVFWSLITESHMEGRFVKVTGADHEVGYAPPRDKENLIMKIRSGEITVVVPNTGAKSVRAVHLREHMGAQPLQLYDVLSKSGLASR